MSDKLNKIVFEIYYDNTKLIIADMDNSFEDLENPIQSTKNKLKGQKFEIKCLAIDHFAVCNDNLKFFLIYYTYLKDLNELSFCISDKAEQFYILLKISLNFENIKIVHFILDNLSEADPTQKSLLFNSFDVLMSFQFLLSSILGTFLTNMSIQFDN
eukprot:snap_masked-scaffold_4-processed-gene-0.31-mRNA-1 protein AED:1.00 eAED:1.00 QI:0/0/0/0/1/1/2/0/156